MAQLDHRCSAIAGRLIPDADIGCSNFPILKCMFAGDFIGIETNSIHEMQLLQQDVADSSDFAAVLIAIS